ncbi:hypothetical protein F4Y93_14030 [Candidatus Poribacteria bacterium]|nr:hypothetical protein [Candidatus Poribacteria bacterium]
MRLISLLLFLLLLLITQPALAIRQGTATADIFIRRYERAGDFGRLALWHEAAAECLKRISVPMNEIAYDYYKQHGYEKWAARAEKEAREIHRWHQYHRTRAETAWQKFVGEVCTPDAFARLNIERENISKFIAVWLPRYQDRFYEFGIYPTFFKKQRELAEQGGDYVKALQLEADAAAMCAAQYAQIPITYGLKNYEKHRDAYQAYASRLRDLAQQNPKTLPPEINGGKQILDSLLIQTNASRLEADVILQIAKSEARVKAALAGQNAVHAYPRFQGFAWIVRFSNHSYGNLVTAIIDEKTAEVLDVFCGTNFMKFKNSIR